MARNQLKINTLLLPLLLLLIMNIAIRATYFIFCRRSKDWTDPDLMDF